MPKNGHSTVATAAEPMDLYDTLTPDEQTVWDSIGTLGYVPEQGPTGLWLARKRAEPKGVRIGPANNLKDLLSRVKDDIEEASDFDNQVDGEDVTTEESGEILLDADHKGNRYLPGAEEVVDEQLKNAIFEEFTDKQAWSEAGKKKQQSKDALAAVVAAKRSLFYPDPANSNDLIYKAGGLTARIKKEFTVSVKTEQSKDEEDD